MKRVLKPDGTIILTVWDLWQKKYWKALAKAIIRSIVTLGTFKINDTFIPWGKAKKPRYYHAFTMKELKILFEETGWNIIELSGSQPSGHDFIVIANP
jgi:hypothetical protein